jgi:hypothetical protein
VSSAALHRLVYEESRGRINVGWDPSHYSAGIGQVSRAVWQKYSSLPFNEAANPKYFFENLTVAAKYLKDLYRMFGSWKLALEGFNEGPGTLRAILAGRRGLSPITQRYVAGYNG